MSFSKPTPRIVGALCFLFACLLIAPAVRAATARVNVTIAFDDAAQQGPTTGIRVEPVTPPWIEGGGVVIGDPIVRSSKTSPVVITNLFGTDNTNTAIYRVTITSRVPTSYYFKAWTTNGNASDWMIAAPGQSSSWVAGHFIQTSRGAGTSNTFTRPKFFEAAAATNRASVSNYALVLTNYTTGEWEWRQVAASGSSSAPSFDSTSGSGFDSQ